MGKLTDDDRERIYPDAYVAEMGRLGGRGSRGIGNRERAAAARVARQALTDAIANQGMIDLANKRQCPKCKGTGYWPRGYICEICPASPSSPRS